MMKPFLLFILSVFSSPAFSQTREEVLSEAFTLYYSERASWLGTDMLLERLRQDSVGGYASYVNSGKPTFIFISKGEKPHVIGSVVFDSTFSKQKATISTDRRTLLPPEQELLMLRKKAVEVLGTDKSVRHYNNTQFNVVPISDKKGKRVYVLTASTEGDVVLFGNDYLLDFDKNGQFKKLQKLHEGLIQAPTPEGDSVVGFIHNHLPGFSETFTPTDLCTVMLYSHYINWSQIVVVSEKKTSIFQVKSRSLIIMDRKETDKILKDAEKRK